MNSQECFNAIKKWLAKLGNTDILITQSKFEFEEKCPKGKHNHVIFTSLCTSCRRVYIEPNETYSDDRRLRWIKFIDQKLLQGV